VVCRDTKSLAAMLVHWGFSKSHPYYFVGKDNRMQVVIEDGYVKVYRRRDLICAAALVGNRVRGLTFMKPEYLNNRTRQAACRAIQKAGYK
jgi:hypothetical protein